MQKIGILPIVEDPLGCGRSLENHKSPPIDLGGILNDAIFQKALQT
jgi:hypothetical protein